MGYVYKITNTINNKSYIGISIHEPEKRRIRQHLSGHGNRIIANAVKKYGKEAFVYEILEANVFDEFLPDLEVAYIAKHNTVAPNGYNLTYGGEGNLQYPEYGGDRNKRERAQRKKRYATDPNFRKKERNRKHEFYINNIESERERGRKYYRENKHAVNTKIRVRRANDPDFRQKQRDAVKKHRSKPGVRKSQRAYGRERYANNPEVRKRQNDLRNERYANDATYRENRKQAGRERYKKLSQDPEYRKKLAEQQRKRFNERYANDPEFRERYKAKKREQYQRRKAKKKNEA